MSGRLGPLEDGFVPNRATGPRSRAARVHLSFGHGAHICVGNMLARMVVMHAIIALAPRFPDLELLDDAFASRLDPFALRGVKALRVRRR